MKICIIILAFFLSGLAIAQSPESFKYQAVVRDASNTILVNQNVGIQLSIQQGSIGGTAVYTETFSETTNAHGILNLEIGTGNSFDDFSLIDWGNGPYFIETSVDINGGTNYQFMGASQLMSVPYALYAKQAENVVNDAVNDADADPNNEIQALSISNDTLYLSNGGQVYLGEYAIDLVDDADADPSNEIQDISLSGTDLTISSGSTLDLSSIDTDTQLDSAAIANFGFITSPNDADADPSNEIQDISLSGTDLTISSGSTLDLSSIDTDTQLDSSAIANFGFITSPNDADADPNNEIQDISLSGTDLTISSGSTLDLSNIDTDTQLDSSAIASFGFVAGPHTVDTDTDDQTLSLSGTTLAIDGGNSVDLSGIDTDDQSLSLSGTDLSIDNGNTVDLSALQDGVNDADSDASNELNSSLQLNGDDLELTDAGGTLTVDMSGVKDNLGDHTATENVELDSNWISFDGSNHGLSIDSLGNVVTSDLVTLGENREDTVATGSIRWNPCTRDFEGFTGEEWRSFTGYPMVDYTGTVSVSEIGQGEIKASDVSTNANFGRRVDIDGNFAVATTFADDKVYVFSKQSSGNWSEDTILTASNASADNRFGQWAAIEGNVIVVGARDQDNGGLTTGAAYRFEYNGTTWTETDIFYASDGADGDRFGSCVDVEGDKILVGAVRTSVGGAAYIYEADGMGGWTETKLEPQVQSNYDGASFGDMVHVADGRAFVGGRDNYGSSGQANCGAVQIFDQASDGSWSRTHNLRGEGSQHHFGTGIDVYEGRLVIGAAKYNGGYGRVYVYDPDANGNYSDNDRTMVQNEDKDNYTDQRFGQSVALEGDYMYAGTWIGSTNNDDAVYVFKHDGQGNWNQQYKITSTNSYVTVFGMRAMAVSNGNMIVGEYLSNFPNFSGGINFIPLTSNPSQASQNLETVGNWISGDGDDEGIYIDSTGAVGIGTLAPGAESTDQASSNNANMGYTTTPWVYSNAIEAQGERGATSTLITIGNDGTYGVDDEVHIVTNGVERISAYSDGSVAIGTISVGSESTDQGTSNHTGDGYMTTPWVYTNAIEAQSERGAASTLITVGNDGTYGADDEIHLVTDGSSDVEITNNLLYVSGSIEYTGTITDVSDQRLKENIKPIDGVLTKLEQINGYSYNMIGDTTFAREYGVMAQDVQKVFPEIVTEIHNKEGYFGVNYIQLVPVLIEGVKEQQTIIENQEKALSQQQSEIDTLKQEMEELKMLLIGQMQSHQDE